MLNDNFGKVNWLNNLHNLLQTYFATDFKHINTKNAITMMQNFVFFSVEN